MKRCICSMIMCAALAWMPMAAQQDGGCFVAKVTEAGQLAEVMGERANEIDSIAVFGPINEVDIDTLAGASYYGKLSVIDLKGSEIHKIPDYAFAGLGDNLKSIVLPVCVIEIGKYAFAEAKVEDINMPASLRWIGNYAFRFSGVNGVAFPEGLEEISYQAFSYCRNLDKVELPTTMRVLADWSFYEAKISEINFPEGLDSIGAEAFATVGRLKQIELPSSCTRLGYAAFANCYELEKAILPEGLTKIPAEFMSQCIVLKEVVIPSSVTEIGASAFIRCALNSVSLPANVEFLNGESFASNPLQKIYSYSANPPKFGYTNNGKSPFEGVDNTIPVYVPKGSLELYKNSDWKYFTNIIEDENMPSGIVDAATDNSVAVSTANGCIEIAAPAGAAYTIYTVDGREMTNGTATETRIPLPKGIYIVSVAGKSYKVSL